MNVFLNGASDSEMQFVATFLAKCLMGLLFSFDLAHAVAF
jgi:hypothetical protein